MAIVDAGEHQPTDRDRGVERPPDHLPEDERRGLGRRAWRGRGAVRVKPDSRVELLHGSKQRFVALLVEGQVDRVFLELHAERAELADAADGLLGRRVWIRERRRGYPAGELLRIPRSEFRHLLVVAANKLDQPRLPEAGINDDVRAWNRGENLTVTGIRVDQAPAHVHVVKSTLGRQERSGSPLSGTLQMPEVGRREDVCPDVDFH